LEEASLKFMQNINSHYSSFVESCDWVMLDFAAPDSDQDYPSNAEGGYWSDLLPYQGSMFFNAFDSIPSCQLM